MTLRFAAANSKQFPRWPSLWPINRGASYTDSQTVRQADRQIDRPTDRQTDRPTGYAFTERTIASRHGPRVINLPLEAAEADAALNCLSSTTKLRKVCRGRAIRRRRGRWGGYGRTRCSASCSDKVQSGFNVGPFVFILD